MANDYGVGFVFSRFVQTLGRPIDVLLAKQPRQQLAQRVQRCRGRQGPRDEGSKPTGKLAAPSDVEIWVPHFGFADRIQKVHIKAIHIMIVLIEEFVFAPA